MKSQLQPGHLLRLILAGWINRRQQDAVAYLLAENQILREKLGKCNIPLAGKQKLLNDYKRRRLVIKGKTLCRKVLDQLATIVTPDTILRWHRELVARHWDYTKNRHSSGRSPVAREIVELVLRMAKEDPTWGYDRIQGALANPGHPVSNRTVGNILKAHGIEPAPDRKRQPTWKTFLEARWDVLASIDFTTIEALTESGLVTYYLLFVMQLPTRPVYFAGGTANQDQPWMIQMPRKLTDAEDGFLRRKKFLVMDRDARLSEEFRPTLKQVGIEAVLLPRSPNLTPHTERPMRSLKDECLHRPIFVGESQLHAAIVSFLIHYHAERNYQLLDNRLIDPGQDVGLTAGEVQCRERLGGILRHYHRKAA